MDNIYDEYDEHDGYGTPDSYLLKLVQQAGFKPIGITVLYCEETFIFKSKQEAINAAEKFLPEGWWYDIGTWIDTRIEYVKDMYSGDDDLAPIIYWLDKNYAPR